MTASLARERDPHFRRIVEGLAGPLDRDLFEECVQDLLRQDFPGLAGVYGGSDGGMDGAIPDGEGAPFTLVVTTAKKVTRNLTSSLDRRIAEGDPRRKAVLATSQALTPRRRKNLHQRASEKGFVLLQIFDRRDIASRLYRDSKWAHQLLGITGEPPALSAVPQTRRPLLDVELVAREHDLTWLRETTGDRLLVGEPGSGKTSLLLQLVEDGTALFLSDIDGFAPAFRDQRPEIVLVDDAHVDPERLDRLRQIRREVHAEDDFAIVATSWKGDRDEVMDSLGISQEKVHTLELLTRSEIVEVYRQIGLHLPSTSSYLADLVTQAANRPGLAVTLGRAWLSGNYDEVLTGQAIYRFVLPFLKRVLDSDPEQILAAFALGGDRGMGLAAVSEFTGQPPGTVSGVVARVGASGILTERGRDEQGEVVLAVNPPQLRAALLDKVFFGEFARPWITLVERAPSLESVVDTLSFAHNRRVAVPLDALQRLLREGGARPAWGTFASSGAEQAAWVLREYPGPVTDIAATTFRSAPRATIRALFDLALKLKNNEVPPEQDPIRFLQLWIQDFPDEDWPGDAINRRRILVDEALKALAVGTPAKVSLTAAFIGLSPRIASYRRTVVEEKIVCRDRNLPVEAVEEIRLLWQDIRKMLPHLCRESWRKLNHVLHQWIRPYPKVTTETQGVFHRFAGQVIEDVSANAEGRPGLQAALRKRAWQASFELDLAGDPVFEALYTQAFVFSPNDDETLGGAYQGAEDARKKTLFKLGRAWATKPVSDALDDLAQYAEEASWLLCSADPSTDFVSVLVQTVAAPETWLAELLDREGEPGLDSLVPPFLWRVVEEERLGWEALVERCLESEKHGSSAAEHVFRWETPSERLLERAVAVVTPQIVETIALQGEMPIPTLRRILLGDDPDLALAGAIGEWLCKPREAVREEIKEPWRLAIINAGLSLDQHPSMFHWRRTILLQDSDLAFEWIRSKANEDDTYLPFATMDAAHFAQVVGSLSDGQRIRLLKELSEDSLQGIPVRHIVDGSPDLYSALLERGTQPALLLAPLGATPPDERWSRLARVALDHGLEPRDIALKSLPFGGLFPHTDDLSKWIAAFEELTASDHPGLREVARHGIKITEERIEKAKAEQHRFDLTGRF